MVSVENRNVMEKYFYTIKACCILFSRIIIKKLSISSKSVFRILEKFLLKYDKLYADLCFLKFCDNNQLLPKFVNFQLYDVSFVNDPATIDFKRKLINNEISKKEEALRVASKDCLRTLIQFRQATSTFHFYSSVYCLKRLVQQQKSDNFFKHNKKLQELYGGTPFIPKIQSYITNLSSYRLSQPEKSLLNKGLNFSTRGTVREIDRKLEMEKVFMSILEKRERNQVRITSEENLKTKLRCFGIKHCQVGKEVLTKEEKNAIKTLKGNIQIVIQRPDKGGGVVVLNRDAYEEKLTNIISDQSKFMECAPSQTEKVKKEINTIARKLKEHQPSLFYKLRRIGDYNFGHLYGLPKLHKNMENPPLRPIISMSGTVTHEVAQYINSLIRPYLNSSQIVTSGTELLVSIGDLTIEPGECLVSLDVESLFTNVPVEQTIDIILAAVYNNDRIPPPTLTSDIMKELLILCTTKTPFQYKNKTYIQSDGISMGSPLGPTFADFYMANLENRLLEEDRRSNPKFYKRYVDDILAIFKRKNHINLFKQRLARSSVLNFTHEEMKDNKFNFLDVHLSLNQENKLTTTVYIKPTDNGLYGDFSAYTPDTYKKSIIKSLVHRAEKYTHSWAAYSTEIDRIKQILSNNNFPQALTERVIAQSLNKYLDDTGQTESQSTVDIFVRLFSLESYTKDKHQLSSILKEHIKPVDVQKVIRVRAYFKPKKLSSSFSTRPRNEDLFKSSHVVYQFQCPKDGCSASYVGYTTCTLEKRIKQHTYSSSSIHKHFTTDHPEGQVPSDIKYNFSIINSRQCHIELKIVEAIIIKTNNPFINVKFNEMSNYLNLYK